MQNQEKDQFRERKGKFINFCLKFPLFSFITFSGKVSYLIITNDNIIVTSATEICQNG